jgi:hypothetical protein
MFGLVFGKWWKIAIPAGAIYWTVTLVNAGNLSNHGARTLMAVAFVGAANTAIGAAVNRGLARLGRKLPDEGRWPDH